MLRARSGRWAQPAAPVRPSVLTPAHWGPRPRRSPAPAAQLLAPWGCPLWPPLSQPPKPPLFPPKQPRLPLQPMHWGDRWHGEAPAAVGQLRAEDSLGQPSGRPAVGWSSQPAWRKDHRRAFMAWAPDSVPPVKAVSTEADDSPPMSAASD